MKYWTLAVLVLFLASCSNQETEQSIRDQITTYKKDINTLNQKIAELEKKLGSMSSGEINSDKIPVDVMAVSYEPFNHFIQVSGTAEAVKEAYISPEVGGQIQGNLCFGGRFRRKGKITG